MLSSLLTVILEKLKWDEEADPEDMDEDDKAAFEDLRKVRRSHPQSSCIDPFCRSSGRSWTRSWLSIPI